MTKKLFLSQVEKEKIEFWWLNQSKIFEKVIFYLILLFLPTQFGRHFWPSFSFVYGIRTDYLSPTIYTTDVLIIILFLLTIKKIKNISRAFYLFLLYLILSLLLTKYWQVGVYELIKILEFSFFAIYASLFVFKKESLLKIICIPFLFESILSIWQFFNKGSIGLIFYFFGERAFNGQTPGIANAAINGQLILRPYGTFSHPNVLAGFLLLIITLIIFSKKRLNLFYSVVLFIGAIALALTFSRITILLFIGVVLLKIFLILRNKKNTYLNLVIYFITLLFLLYVIFISPFSARFLNTSLVDSSLTQRYDLISASYEMFLKSPFLGLGLNSFLPSLPEYLSQQKTLFIQPVHNIYLLILSELGIIGLSFFVLLIFKALKTLLQKNSLLIILLIEILILGFFDHYFLTLQQGQLLFALIVGLSFSKLRLNIE